LLYFSKEYSKCDPIKTIVTYNLLIKKYWVTFVIFFFLLMPTVNSYAQNKLPFYFTIKNFTQDEGLPQNSVNDIDQTKDGYIWVATNGGLARFNGISFKLFNKFNSPGLVSDRILSLFTDKEGRLWISTNEGLSFYYKGIFKEFTEKDGLKIISSLEVKQDKNGTIWVLTFPEFYQYKDGKFFKQEIKNDEKLRRQALAGGADFFIPFRNNIYAVIDNKVVLCQTIGEYPDIQILDVVENPKGSIWIATTSNRLINIQNEITEEFRLEKGIEINYLDDLFIDAEKRLWIANSYGAAVLTNNEFYKITANEGLPKSQVHQIFQDTEGNFWLGTETEGLIKISRSLISNYSKSDGLDNNQILSLNYSKNESLLIGTNGGGIYELQDEKIIYSTLNKFFNQIYVWSIFEDSQNRIWSNVKELFFVKDNKKYYVPDSQQYDLHNIYAFYESKDGAVWIGYQFGLLKYFNDSLINYSSVIGLPDLDVRCILEESNGNIWIGTVNGIFEIRNEKLISYPSIQGLRNYYFRSIYQDKDDVMWFGTYGGGLLRLKNDKFFIFSTDNGLLDNVISHIIEDDDGNFWMGSNRGIQKISRQELNDFAEGKSKSFFVYKYDKSDGMISSETNGGFQPSAVKDNNGNIYFPTINGIVVVHTNEKTENKIIPPVHIGEVFVNGIESEFNDLQINYDSSNVEIYFDILSYSQPHKNQAKYIMEGYDNGWNDAGDLRHARYTSLPPGEYIFKVIGSNSDNLWNEEPAAISITVLPPFWMTWWFRTIIILLFLSILPIIFYKRFSALKRKQQLQHEFSEKLIYSQEQERMRIAQELHDSLGQDLLLIKNRAVLGIKNFDDAAKAKKQLEHISDSAASAITRVRQISHNLRPPELDRLGLTETMRSIISEIESADLIKIISEINNIDDTIPKEKEINLIRILQEALSNILKHSGAAVINISITKRKNTILLIIKDNGKGFNTEYYSNGLGIMSINERADILGGTVTINSIIGKGTTLSVEIPVKND